ncbi:transglycosylase SLT domain-containing protein [Aerosticca soli]|uniref:Membrane-bound lytic murein transglycosylase D n=1 Tax=Aerosticca soli TaxID=2010829 RepID=A0A2Z6E4H6_9GAMM|nr:transglycosylase SLT domain-containing protein [Aerosticca soli]BBD79674.1 membrane-bound lytic murein transglycosylase D precursor [Aerosticca soli]
MMKPTFARTSPRWLTVMLSGLLSACAGGATRHAPASAEQLYGRLDQAGKSYELALQQAREGHASAAEKTLDAALDELKDAAARCPATAGCDPQRFFAVFDRLLRLKDGSFFAGDDADLVGGGPEAGHTGSEVSPAAASLPQAQRSVTLLRGQKLSELIAMNGPVKAALEMWLTQWRPNLMDAWVNYQFMRYQMWPSYQQAELPEALLFGILAKESGGKVHAVSRAGAAGPLQFMYATGLRFGLSSDGGFDQRFDPALAARANAEYLDEQLKAFNNNLELVLAAYNGGEGRIRRMVGDDPSVSLYDPRIYNQLSQETREYVPAVLAAAWLFLHPESYNLRFPKIEGAPGEIVLKRPASLTELTVCLGSAGGMYDGWFRTLRNLNPRFDPQAQQPAGSRLAVPKELEKAYAARCVDGPWPILAADLHQAVVPAVIETPSAGRPGAARVAARTRSYTVRRGDTLSSIAHRSSCASVQDLAELNGLGRQALKPGQVLRLPVCR